jgi:hypothetical protein
MTRSFPLLVQNVAAMLRVGRVVPDSLRPFRVWGYPWTPELSGIAACAIAVNLLLARAARIVRRTAIILLGSRFSIVGASSLSCKPINT